MVRRPRESWLFSQHERNPQRSPWRIQMPVGLEPSLSPVRGRGGTPPIGFRSASSEVRMEVRCRGPSGTTVGACGSRPIGSSSPGTVLYRVRIPNGPGRQAATAIFPLRRVVAKPPGPHAGEPSASIAPMRCSPGSPHVVHLLGRRLHRDYHIPWLADFRDPWSASGRSDLHGRKPPRWETWAEKAVLNDAGRIVANTPRARGLLASAFPQHAAKMVSITNGYDPESFALTLARASDRETIDVVHPGEVYSDRDPGPLLEAIRAIGPGEIPNGRTLRLRFIGRQGAARCPALMS